MSSILNKAYHNLDLEIKIAEICLQLKRFMREFQRFVYFLNLLLIAGL